MRREISTCPKWMVTMGDCMSLLLTFFVLLLTFSTVKEDLLMEMIGVINGALHNADDLRMDATTTAAQMEAKRSSSANSESRGQYERRLVDDDELAPAQLRSTEFQQRFRNLRSRLNSLGFAHQVTVEQVNEGMAMRVDLATLFAPGTDRLLPEAWPILAAFADLAADSANEIRLSLRLAATPEQEAGSAATSLRLPLLVGHALSERYGLARERFANGVMLGCEGSPPQLELMLVDTIRSVDVSIRDVVKGHPMSGSATSP